MPRENNKTRILKSSGNVFADLRLPNAEEKHTKVRLAVAINHILAERGLSQTRAARHLGINQPKISALAHYRLDGFSVERLMHFLGRLGCDIEIVIRPRGKHAQSSSILVYPERRSRRVSAAYNPKPCGFRIKRNKTG